MNELQTYYTDLQQNKNIPTKMNENLNIKQRLLNYFGDKLSILQKKKRGHGVYL